MHRRNQKRLSKLIFAILARNPFEYGIVPDEHGWVRLKDLHWALRQGDAFPALSAGGLQQFFELYRPEKMEIKAKLVRVLPEFHAPEMLDFPQSVPPARLYLPIRPRAHAHVLTHGVRPCGNLKWIVLWKECEQAITAGKRRDREPIIAMLDTSAALREGAVFRCAGDEIFLTQWLNTRWLDLPPLPESRESVLKNTAKEERVVQARSKAEDDRMTPGSFIPDALPLWYSKKQGKVSKRGGKGRKRVKKRR